MRLILAALAAAALALAATAAAATRPPARDVRVAMVAPLSGAYAGIGAPGVKAAKQAVQELNAKGGVRGHRIVLDVFDDKTDPATSVAITKKIVADKRYVATIGTVFASAALADQPFVRGKMLYLGMSASTAQVTPPQDGVYVVPPTSTLFAERLAGALQKAHITRVALLHDDGAYPTEGIANVKALARRFGLQIVSEQVFPLTATDWTQQLATVKASDAQALWLWNLPQAVAITKQFKAMGLPQKLVLSGGNATSSYTEPACPAANGAYIASALAEVAGHLPKSHRSRALALHVDKVTGTSGDQFSYDGYTGVRLLADAIEQAKGRTDRATLMRQFRSLRSWQAEGLYEYSAKRHVGLDLDSVVSETIQDCKLVPLPGQPQFAAR